MRRLSIIAALPFALAGLAGVAQAAPPACGGNVTVDCIKDDVLILDGDQMVDGRLLVADPADSSNTMACKDAGKAPTFNSDCKVNYADAVTRAIQVVGPMPDNQWDEFVIFGQQVAPATNSPGPLFYREGYREKVSPGVNEVDHIGLPLVPRVAGRPLVGYVAAGGTGQPVGAKPAPLTDVVSAKYGPCGKAPRTAADTPPASLNPALCYPSFYNFYDALAQATGSIYGPYLQGAPGSSEQNGLSVLPWTKPGIVSIVDSGNGAAKTVAVQGIYEGLQPRVWNSLLNLRGSLFAGNYFRDNGNGTFESTLPTPFFGINLPYPAGWKAGTVLSGTQILRFQPLDLYVMGLLPANAPELQNIQSFMDVKETQVYRPTTTTFGGAVGPQMGLRQGVAVRPTDPTKSVIKFPDIATWNGGLRSPPFESAPHALKQLWVMVTKPKALAHSMDMAEDMLRTAELTKHQNWVNIWRRTFSPYYYMLTGYRGRVVTTVDGVEDNAYWEFGQPVDDMKELVPFNGAAFQMNGPEQVPNSPEIKTAMRFTAVPAGGGVKYAGKGLRIIGKGITVPYNAVTVRMRIPPGVSPKAFATLTFDNGLKIRIPSSCGMPAREGCNEAAFLIPDGKWRNYSAALDGRTDPGIDPMTMKPKDVFTENKDFTGKTFSGFTFSPTSEAFTAADPNNPDTAIEVEFIRIGNVASSKDNDTQSCVTCSACGTLDIAQSKANCTAACASKGQNDRAESIVQADGWLDSEDNCPTVFNPLQEDGNNDGVGDACEDFDGDGKVNSCDNCPTATNSRQRDEDGNGVGDVCDSTSSSSCFLKPDTLAGRAPIAPSSIVSLAFGVVVGLLAFRRRKRG
jgi:hypothetical protein